MIRHTQGRRLRAGIQGGGGVVPSTTFNLLSAEGIAASGFTHSGPADRRYRASTMKLAWSASNTPRLHHSESGVPLGVLFEKAHVFKCRLKTNPTSASGAFSGGQNANTTHVSDSAFLTGLSEVGGDNIYTSGWLIDNSASGVDFGQQILATTGNTNKHSWGVIAKTDAAGGTSGVYLSGNGSVANSPLSQPDTWESRVWEDLTPTSTARLMQLLAKAGKKLWIAQLDLCESIDFPQPLKKDVEPAGHYTATPDSATRLLSGVTGWNATEVAIGIQFYQQLRFASASEVIFSLTDADDATTYLEVRGGASNTLEVELVVSGVSVFSVTGLAVTRNQVNRVVLRLKANSFAVAVNGVLATLTGGTGAFPAALDTININKRGTNYGISIMQSIEVSAASLDNTQVTAASVVDAMGIF